MATTIDTALLTVPEAATALRLSRGTVYKKIQRGELPAVYVGATVRVPAAALARALTRSGRGPGFAS
jgi:excisionase family DNA binding protein